MKKLNAILMLVNLGIVLLMSSISYAAYTISLTDLKVSEISINIVDETSGEPPVTTKEVVVNLHVILYNAEGKKETKVYSVVLTSGQKTHLKADFVPLVQAACAEYDVLVPAWAQ